ncbi:MAG: MFS transporter [Lapillicoccus sp.]
MTDTLTPAQTDRAALRQKRAGLALLALAVGGFAIGTTEFVTMGLLPEVATGTGTDIPTAGHSVSAYGLGVVVGALLIAVLAARMRRKTVLIALMAWFAVANAASGFAFDYGWLMLARFSPGCRTAPSSGSARSWPRPSSPRSGGPGRSR